MIPEPIPQMISRFTGTDTDANTDTDTDTQADAESRSPSDEDYTAHRYTETQHIPTSVVSTCLYAAGYQQWLSPNSDYDHALEAQRLCQSLYALLCIHYHQTGSIHHWQNTREFRENIFEDRFYCPEEFDEHSECETPDEMFDQVEVNLVAYELVADGPPERTREYVPEAQIQE